MLPVGDGHFGVAHHLAKHQRLVIDGRQLTGLENTRGRLDLPGLGRGLLQDQALAAIKVFDLGQLVLVFALAELFLVPAHELFRRQFRQAEQRKQNFFQHASRRAVRRLVIRERVLERGVQQKLRHARMQGVCRHRFRFHVASADIGLLDQRVLELRLPGLCAPDHDERGGHVMLGQELDPGHLAPNPPNLVVEVLLGHAIALLGFGHGVDVVKDRLVQGVRQGHEHIDLVGFDPVSSLVLLRADVRLGVQQKPAEVVVALLGLVAGQAFRRHENVRVQPSHDRGIRLHDQRTREWACVAPFGVFLVALVRVLGHFPGLDVLVHGRGALDGQALLLEGVSQRVLRFPQLVGAPPLIDKIVQLVPVAVKLAQAMADDICPAELSQDCISEAAAVVMVHADTSCVIRARRTFAPRRGSPGPCRWAIAWVAMRIVASQAGDRGRLTAAQTATPVAAISQQFLARRAVWQVLPRQPLTRTMQDKRWAAGVAASGRVVVATCGAASSTLKHVFRPRPAMATAYSTPWLRRARLTWSMKRRELGHTGRLVEVATTVLKA